MHFIFHLFVCLDVGKIMSFGINVTSWRFTLTLRTICQIRTESKILSFHEKSGSKKTRILACFMQFGVCLCSFKIFTYLPTAKKNSKNRDREFMMFVNLCEFMNFYSLCLVKVKWVYFFGLLLTTFLGFFILRSVKNGWVRISCCKISRKKIVQNQIT